MPCAFYNDSSHVSSVVRNIYRLRKSIATESPAQDWNPWAIKLSSDFHIVPHNKTSYVHMNGWVMVIPPFSVCLGPIFIYAMNSRSWSRRRRGAMARSELNLYSLSGGGRWCWMVNGMVVEEAAARAHLSIRRQRKWGGEETEPIRTEWGMNIPERMYAEAEQSEYIVSPFRSCADGWRSVLLLLYDIRWPRHCVLCQQSYSGRVHPRPLHCCCCCCCVDRQQEGEEEQGGYRGRYN